MTGADFARAVDELLDRLCRQDPVAILQYGSSLRPQDFVPGQSDLDLIVISDEPLRDVANSLGYRYAFISPRDFVAGIAAGDMFWLSALQSGQVRHDPRGFFRHLFALIDSGLDVRPNLVTIQSCAALIGSQLGGAIDGYLGGAAAGPILRLIYSAAKAVGGYLAIASTGADPHGFDGIVRCLEQGPGRFAEVAALMRHTRERMRSAPGAADPDPRPRVRIGGDEIGELILAVERAYLGGVALLPGRRPTNDLIDDFERAHGPIRRTLAVRMDMIGATHVVIGELTDGYAWFGLGDARHPRGGWFAHRVASRAELDRALPGLAASRPAELVPDPEAPR